MKILPASSAAGIDGAVSISLAERLTAFDLDGTLVADAREIAEVVDGREREVSDAKMHVGHGFRLHIGFSQSRDWLAAPEPDPL